MRHVLLLIAIATLSSCHYAPTEPKFSGNYPTKISAIIEVNCLGGDCHSGSTDLNEHFDLSSWDAMTRGGTSFNEVIPFSICKSHLFGHINTDSNVGPIFTPEMPLARAPLSAADQKAIFDWISEGAKSADRKIPYSGVTKKIFVASGAENMVSVIDADTKRLVRVIPIGASGDKAQPIAIAMTPDRKSFITGILGGTGMIKKIDAASYTITGEFASNLAMNEIALTPDGSKGYITDNSSITSTNFGVFDAVAMKLTKTISTPLILQPYGVIASPDGKYVYMSGYSSDNILRIDSRTDSIIGNLPLGADVPVPVTQGYLGAYSPSEMAISADSKRLYVACYNSIEVVVFDLEKDTIMWRIPLHFSPVALALSPDGSELWTASWANTVYVTSTATNEILATIDSVNNLPHAIAFTPVGKYVYVACESLSGGGQHHSSTGAEAPPSSVVVIDRATRKIISTLEMPGYSVGVVVGFGN